MSQIKATSIPEPTAAASSSDLAKAGWTAGNLKGDFAGGLTAALITFAESIPYGLLVFAPLGAVVMAHGPVAALYAAGFGGLVATLCGGTPLLISGPRASTAIILAAIMGRIAAVPDLELHGGAGIGIAIAGLALATAGALQAAFGLFRLGLIIKFIPYPVVAGFMNGLAFVILANQIKALLGLPSTFAWSDIETLTLLWHPTTALVGVATLVGLFASARFLRPMPNIIGGIAAGITAQYILTWVFGTEAAPTVGNDIALTAPSLAALVPAIQQLSSAWLWHVFIDISPLIAVLAVVGAVDSLMSAAALDGITNDRHRSNRELSGQGFANLAAALMGGVPVSGSVSRGAASFRAGARTRWAGVVHGFAVLAAIPLLGPYVGSIPKAVLAAILIGVALGMIDAWSRELLSRLRAERGLRADILTSLAIVILVAGTVVAYNIVAAVAVGVLLAMILFVKQMSRPIVKRVTDGSQRRSLKVREREDAECLSAHGADIVIIELEGPVFFGTAEALVGEVERHLSSAKNLIIDFRLAPEIDATGARQLVLLARKAASFGRVLSLSHITTVNRRGKLIAAIAGTELFRVARCFANTDIALESAEDEVLQRYTGHARRVTELALNELCLTEGLWEEDIEVLGGYLTRCTFHAGDVLFRAGDAGSSLYLLAHGAVTISLPRANRQNIRLATLIPGVMFGEMALLEGQPRSADAVAAGDIVTYQMDQSAFTRILAEHPVLAARLMANMAREIASRLRTTSDQLRALS